LHLLLLRSFRDRISILRRGLFFMGVPAAASTDNSQNGPISLGKSWSKLLRSVRQLISYLAWFVFRSAIRLGKFPPFLLHGLRIWFSPMNLAGKAGLACPSTFRDTKPSSAPPA